MKNIWCFCMLLSCATLLSAQSHPCVYAPPAAPRSMAEWEELQAICLSWQNEDYYPAILSQIVNHAKSECEVIVFCDNIANVQNYLTIQGIDLSTNVTLLQRDLNSIWIRDYGANTIYLNDVDTLALVDWKYNRPSRTRDDTSAYRLANYLQVPLYCTSDHTNEDYLIHTGGNFMSDGLGTGFSSHLVTEENPSQTPAEINAIMQRYMGIHQYALMQTLPYDYIHHIDMHMKLLDEETLLVGQYPEGIADGPQIEANLQYVLSNFTTPFGTPYNVVRIPMPPQNNQYPDNGGDYRTYTNAVFVNKTILVPTYETRYDTTALRIWREAMPGYQIKGINSNAIIPLSGAIHCITKEVGVDDPLWIVHQPLRDVTVAQADGYPVTANIKHQSGIAAATLWYKTDTTATAPYTALPMSPNTDSTTWQTNIPQQPNMTTVHYYIAAAAHNGKQQVRPMPAPAGYWQFKVDTGVAAYEPKTPQAALTNVFPNPAAAITCVKVNAARAVRGTLLLKDIVGRTVATLHDGTLPSGESHYLFQAASFASGIYFVTLAIEQYPTQVQKIIIR